MIFMSFKKSTSGSRAPHRDRGLTLFDTTQLRRGRYFAGEIK